LNADVQAAIVRYIASDGASAPPIVSMRTMWRWRARGRRERSGRFREFYLATSRAMEQAVKLRQRLRARHQASVEEESEKWVRKQQAIVEQKRRARAELNEVLNKQHESPHFWDYWDHRPLI
jgi:hypothetical protein